ncbi:hypothetical protein ACHAWC_007461 [Mediolabrus comicus]
MSVPTNPPTSDRVVVPQSGSLGGTQTSRPQDTPSRPSGYVSMSYSTSMSYYGAKGGKTVGVKGSKTAKVFKTKGGKSDGSSYSASMSNPYNMAMLVFSSWRQKQARESKALSVSVRIQNYHLLQVISVCFCQVECVEKVVVS